MTRKQLLRIALFTLASVAFLVAKDTRTLSSLVDELRDAGVRGKYGYIAHDSRFVKQTHIIDGIQIRFDFAEVYIVKMDDVYSHSTISKDIHTLLKRLGYEEAKRNTAVANGIKNGRFVLVYAAESCSCEIPDMVFEVFNDF